jgi:hypothetical protein
LGTGSGKCLPLPFKWLPRYSEWSRPSRRAPAGLSVRYRTIFNSTENSVGIWLEVQAAAPSLGPQHGLRFQWRRLRLLHWCAPPTLGAQRRPSLVGGSTTGPWGLHPGWQTTAQAGVAVSLRWVTPAMHSLRPDGGGCYSLTGWVPETHVQFWTGSGLQKCTVLDRILQG